jgi:hypothetical protein
MENMCRVESACLLACYLAMDLHVTLSTVLAVEAWWCLGAFMSAGMTPPWLLF